MISICQERDLLNISTGHSLQEAQHKLLKQSRKQSTDCYDQKQRENLIKFVFVHKAHKNCSRCRDHMGSYPDIGTWLTVHSSSTSPPLPRHTEQSLIWNWESSHREWLIKVIRILMCLVTCYLVHAKPCYSLCYCTHPQILNAWSQSC